MTIRLAPTAATARHLAEVAQGREPADAVVLGGSLVNVWTEEIQAGWGVAIAGGRIAYVGPDAEVEQRSGERTWVIELGGDWLAPGLVEGHTHLTRVTIAETAAAQVRCGVTTTVLETMELGYVTGPGGVRELLAEAEAAPGRVFFTISGSIAIDHVAERRLPPAEDWIALLDHPRVAGVGEAYWADLLRGHPRTEALIEAALARDLVAEGHGAGARPQALAALAALGVSGDHEGINADDVRTRLRLGLWTLARHGATRQDLPAIADVWRTVPELSLSHLALVTDGVEPEELARGQSLNAVVEHAIELGLAPARAIRLASRNVAERFGFARWLGATVPGALADLAVVRPGTFRPRLVLVGGEEPSPARAHRYPDWMLACVRLPDFDRSLLEHPGPGRWRAMRFDAPLVTREVETDGTAAIPVVAIDRLGSDRAFRGLALGLGITDGGVALSSAWESPSVIACGDRPRDLAIALERLQALGGGAVVVRGGAVLAEWRAEVGGLYTQAPMTDAIAATSAVNGALRELGCPFPNPLLSLETLTTAAIPFLRISAGGYVRLRDGARLGLEVLE